jgi:uncharacterized protein
MTNSNLVLAAVALGVLGSGPLGAQSVPADIVTTGAAQVRLPPDRALISIGIETRGSTAAAASSANARPVNRVRDTLAALGFSRDSVRVSSYTVEGNYDHERGGKLIDYEATTILAVRTRALPRMGLLFDAVLGAGATNIAQVEFESDTLESARRQALAVALNRAKADAAALAAAAGGRLGRLLHVTTGAQFGRPIYAMEELRLRGAASAAYAGGAPIVNRDVVLGVAVEAKWEFLPL